MEQVKHQTLFETWIATAEEKFNKDVVRDFCQIELLSESHRSELFAEFLEISDKWDQHFKVESSSQFEKGESSSA